MQQTLPPPPVRLAHSRAQRAVRGKIGRARFTRADATYDLRRGEVTVGIWLLDRAAAEYPSGIWPVRRATLHWQRHDIVVGKALNYEFQIDEEVPFAELSEISFHPNLVILTFGRSMCIKVGVGELCISCRRTKSVRTDWGVPGWAFTFATSTPVLTIRGS